MRNIGRNMMRNMPLNSLAHSPTLPLRACDHGDTDEKYGEKYEEKYGEKYDEKYEVKYRKKYDEKYATCLFSHPHCLCRLVTTVTLMRNMMKNIRRNMRRNMGRNMGRNMLRNMKRNMKRNFGEI